MRYAVVLGPDEAVVDVASPHEAAREFIAALFGPLSRVVPHGLNYKREARTFHADVRQHEFAPWESVPGVVRVVPLEPVRRPRDERAAYPVRDFPVARVASLRHS